MGTILVTGGAGFIGSNFINRFLKKNPGFLVVNIDKLTYAGSLSFLKEAEKSDAYRFVRGDICDIKFVEEIMARFEPDFIINFAAESHVDRSISNPLAFVRSNILGASVMLNCAHRVWERLGFEGKRFIQISTDEVYGSLGPEGAPFTESSPLAPNSPYSASKAGADMMVRAYVKTYGFPAIITRCCNNYGPCQNAEKFIPTCIMHATRNEPIPVYGNGMNIREWIHVLDHCEAIERVLFEGIPGETYNIGSGEELSNLELAGIILRCMNKPEKLIKMVSDRPGHDFRYALNSGKAGSRLNWACKYTFADGIRETIRWYTQE